MIASDRFSPRGLHPVSSRKWDYRVFYLSATGACDQFMHTDTVLHLTQDDTPPEVFRDRYIGQVVDMVMASLTPKK